MKSNRAEIFPKLIRDLQFRNLISFVYYLLEEEIYFNSHLCAIDKEVDDTANKDDHPTPPTLMQYI